MKNLFSFQLCRVATVCGLAFLALPAHGDVTGFGGNGAGWTLNTSDAGKPATIAGNVLTATQAGNYTVATSAWNNTAQSVTGNWTATFTYTKTANDPGGNTVISNGGAPAPKYADGFTFTIQSAGLNALGAVGGSLGYPNGTVGFALKTTDFASFQDQGFGFFTNAASFDVNSLGTLNLIATNLPVVITVSYNAVSHTLTASASQGGNTANAQLNIDLAAKFGVGGTAFIGFTGATGDLTQTTQISNFSFVAPTGSGNFAGLIHTPGTNDSEMTGFANVQNTGGAISGLVFWQGYRFGVGGGLDANGQFKVTIRKANTKRGRFTATFDTKAIGGLITVNVDDGATHANGLLLPAVQVPPGYFTAHFETGGGRGGQPGLTNGQAPGGPNLGTGYATMHAKANGLVRLVGRLPDGKRFSAGTVVTMLGTFPFYSGQYMRVKRGSAYGDFAFPFDGVTFSPMLQHRPPSNGPLYPGGFDVIETFVCNRYTLTPKGTPVLPFDQGSIPNGGFDLFNGNLPGASFLDIVCDGRNRITFASLNPMAIVTIIYRHAGLFHGVFHTPTGARKTFGGSIVQGEDLAAGLFFGSTETGTAEFFPFTNN